MDKVVIFTKAPVPGHVKTRLCPPLTPREAASLYKALARDTLNTACSVPGIEIEIAYDATVASPNLNWLKMPENVSSFLQEGANLGERIIHAFNQAFGSSANKVVIIGSDCPHIKPREMQQAFLLLDHHDVVLGPARDGGYYLIGLKKPEPFLFKNMAWSTAEVLNETTARIKSLGLSAGFLATLYDIDTMDDLERLLESLRRGEINWLGSTKKVLEALCRRKAWIALMPEDYIR